MMIVKIYDSYFAMVVLGSESQDGNIIEGDFLKLSAHFETDTKSFYLFNLVCFLWCLRMELCLSKQRWAIVSKQTIGFSFLFMLVMG